MKIRITKSVIIGTLLMVIGLSFIGSAYYMKYVTNKKQNAMLNSFQNVLDNKAKIENDTSKKDNAENPPIKPNKEEVGGVVGIMLIPKLDLKVAIGEGVDLETLKYSVGHFSQTPMPGEKGNFSVAGHRSYTYGEYFNRLDELKIGDKIIVKTTKGEFTYNVNEIKIVEPTEVSVLDNTKDSTITLVTCTPIRVATHRLIVKGKLQ